MEVFGIPVGFEPAEPVIQIVRRISIFELLSVLGIAIALISLVLSMLANGSQAKTRRAEFSFRVWEAFMADPMHETFHDIDYNRLAYPTAPRMALLQTNKSDAWMPCYISWMRFALLVSSRVIMRRDRQRWRYRGVRIINNPSIQAYLKYLDGLYSAHGKMGRAHEA